MKQAVIKILDEVNAVILGLEPRDIKFFYERFGIYAKGYLFSPKFVGRGGWWDGKIRFFSDAAKTYVQLLPEIVPFLTQFGYKLKLEDSRKYHHIDIPKLDKNFLSDYPDPLEPDKPLILGDHQVDAVNILTENNNGLVVLGTGAGKSIVTACLLRLYKQHCNYKILVIVPTSDLVHQTSADLAEYGNDVGIYCGDEKDVNHDHVVSTWQALQNNKSLVGMFQGIIVDECHGVTGAVLREIINDYGSNSAIKIGVTGTLPEDEVERMQVRISLGNVLLTVSVAYLMEIGWLAKIHLELLQLEEDLQEEWTIFQSEFPTSASKLNYTKYKEQFLPEYAAEVKYLKNKAPRNEFIINLIEMATEMYGNSLVLVDGVAYGKKLAAMIPDSHFIYGKDKNKVRKQIYDMFAENDNIVLITSFRIGSTGLNIRRIFNEFFIDAGRGFVKLIQSLGRGARRAKDKNSFRVYDIGSDMKFSKRHLTARKKSYKQENHAFTLKKIDYMKILNDNS